MGRRQASMEEELEQRAEPFEQLIVDFETAEREYDVKKKELIGT